MNGIESLPLDPQSALDLIFAGTFYTSSDQRGQLLGEHFLIEYFKNLRIEHKDDKKALVYINSIEPIIGSALRAFAVEKLNYNREVLPLQRMSIGEEKAINEHMNLMPFNDVAKATNRVNRILIYSAFGIAGGAASILGSEAPYNFNTVALALFFGTTTIITSFIIGSAIKTLLVKRLIKNTTKQLDKCWTQSYQKYRSILIDALISIIRVKEAIYPSIKTFEDGHFFPRNELPYFVISNSEKLEPSPRDFNSLIDELSDIIDARMSIKPGLNRIKWLKERAGVSRQSN
jgi:hypothetical protein